MTVDAHQHFWSYNESDYVWMGEGMDILRHDHTPEDLAPLLRDAGVAGTVAVQARQMVQETEYLLALSHQYDWIHGVVGWLDFKSGNLEADLERYSGDDKLKGLRELIHDMPDPEYAVSRQHTEAIRRLGSYNLTYDLLLRPEHIEPATRLVDAFPRQLFVIDHIAKPDIAGGAIEPWRSAITEIAKREHVYCKLSGMVTEANWHSWRYEQMVPYLDICLEAFGPERLMVGSDWPVCTLAGEYGAVMAVVTDYVSSLTRSEQQRVLGQTSVEFYGLAPRRGSYL